MCYSTDIDNISAALKTMLIKNDNVIILIAKVLFVWVKFLCKYYFFQFDSKSILYIIMMFN